MKKVSAGNNPHVVKMVGCVTLSSLVMLMVEYVSHGNLRVSCFSACKKRYPHAKPEIHCIMVLVFLDHIHSWQKKKNNYCNTYIDIKYTKVLGQVQVIYKNKSMYVVLIHCMNRNHTSTLCCAVLPRLYPVGGLGGYEEGGVFHPKTFCYAN